MLYFIILCINIDPKFKLNMSLYFRAVYVVSWTIPFSLRGRTEPYIDLHVKASTHSKNLILNTRDVEQT